ncbi:MAG: hypothetical protein KC656_06745, partial [Myxococcales bacterium]|nr:hypothetical protein [Myxococcales bacterium]
SPDDPLGSLVARWARTHGPFTAPPLAARYGLPLGAILSVLMAMEGREQILRGGLSPGGSGEEWCDPEVMRRLRRRSLAMLRKEVAPVEPEVYARFLAGWHGIGSTRRGLSRLEEVVDQLEGLPLPFSALESTVLPQRMADYSPSLLDQLGMTGQVVWLGRGALGGQDGRVALYRRENVGLLVDPPEVDEAFFTSDPLRRALLDHLEARGACFLVELQNAARQSNLNDVTRALWDLVWAGLVTNDTFLPLRGLAVKARQGSARRARAQTAGGRWSCVTSLIGPPADATERAHARARPPRPVRRGVSEGRAGGGGAGRLRGRLPRAPRDGGGREGPSGLVRGDARWRAVRSGGGGGPPARVPDPGPRGRAAGGDGPREPVRRRAGLARARRPAAAP